MCESSFEEPGPAPVFVDQSGLRGRLLRGVGWPVSVVGAILAVAMGSSLIGVQADAPAMGIPAQPSRPPAPSPSPAPSRTPSSASTASSAPRTVARSATPQTKSSAATLKTAAATSKSSAATSKTGATPKPGATAPRGAKPSGRPAKQP
ncbi:hypothetical protein OG594_37070 [Streptomyces sp. NBC_01214]|uniref:hypothetical protein n=1 Tax=Streptomyces sp. NBC_01214 TaxID=2903777 RepID=UPI0022594B19|nr:hypothetical protein [Streptomyces sp. NBC_01214]MCX4807161.1 hypothetical protein [Streptomyces sp. NBC_01214]